MYNFNLFHNLYILNRAKKKTKYLFFIDQSKIKHHTLTAA